MFRRRSAPKSPYIGVAIVVALGLLALGLQWYTRKSNPIQPYAMSLVAPVYKEITVAYQTTRSQIDRFVGYEKLRRENERLEMAVMQLTRKMEELKGYTDENQRLRRLLKFQETSDFQVIPAQIIAVDATAWLTTVVINKGSYDGVREHQAVVAPANSIALPSTSDMTSNRNTDGNVPAESAQIATDVPTLTAVGKVIKVMPHAAFVRLIVDAESTIAVMLENTRRLSLLKGRGDGRTCIIKDVPSTTEVKTGVKILIDKRNPDFPSGMVVGYIQSVDAKSDPDYLHLIVQPLIDFTRLEEVFLVK
ncbi:MAG: rod shape-determining protein MreC [Candidatus Poribacteria bacterium]